MSVDSDIHKARGGARLYRWEICLECHSCHLESRSLTSGVFGRGVDKRSKALDVRSASLPCRQSFVCEIASLVNYP